MWGFIKDFFSSFGHVCHFSETYNQELDRDNKVVRLHHFKYCRECGKTIKGKIEEVNRKGEIK